QLTQLPIAATLAFAAQDDVPLSLAHARRAVASGLPLPSFVAGQVLRACGRTGMLTMLQAGLEVCEAGNARLGTADVRAMEQLLETQQHWKDDDLPELYLPLTQRDIRERLARMCAAAEAEGTARAAAAAAAAAASAPPATTAAAATCMVQPGRRVLE
ncbi:MAG: hypothetical protein ACK4ZJ_17585, partial [Allorhizobium sp.]